MGGEEWWKDGSVHVCERERVSEIGARKIGWGMGIGMGGNLKEKGGGVRVRREEGRRIKYQTLIGLLS